MRTYTCNSKLQDIYERCIHWMTALLSEISIFCVRAGCEIRLMTYGSKHSLQFLLISHLCVLTCITWKLHVVYGHSAYQMTALPSDTFLVWFRVARSNWRAMAQTCISLLWYKVVCVYCKPVYTSLFGAQLHDNRNSRTCTFWLHITHQSFTANDASFYKNKIC